VKQSKTSCCLKIVFIRRFLRAISLFYLLVWLSACANSQQQVPRTYRLVGGPCEGCEAVFEYGNQSLNATDTLPDFADSGTKIKLTGIIYQPDGTTPASDVILYIYHTNAAGVYPTRSNETDWSRRHGYIRGWIKTGKDGRYTFYTLRPGQYPNRAAPIHIHATILEPNGRYYYLNDYHFKDDPSLSAEATAQTSLRGGDNWVLTLEREGNLLVGRSNIILGKNVPGYTDNP
jgi:protocatechuate 3,4-dioxygenase, beta subunit